MRPPTVLVAAYSKFGMSPRRWLLATGVLLLTGLLHHLSRHLETDRAPAVLHTAIAAHDSSTRTITAQIGHERAMAAAAARAESAAVVQVHRRSRDGLRSLRRSPVAPPPPEDAADSATMFVASILAAEDSALGAADARATALGTALDLSELRATESDSLLHVSAKLVDRPPPCRLLRFVPCPSRTAAALLAAAAMIAIAR